MGSDSVKKRQSSAKRGGRAARSTAEWWSPARTAAFEALRRGEKPDVPRRTLEGWQAAPQWQAKLAKREAAVDAAATKAEIEPLERLRSYLDRAVDAVGQMAAGELQACKTRLAAAKDILDRFRVVAPSEGDDIRIAAILVELTRDV